MAKSNLNFYIYASYVLGFLLPAFDVLKSCSGSKFSNVRLKRQESGHKNTSTAICVTCYNAKRRCSLGRFNKSIEHHQKNVHQYGEKIDVISSEDPRAISILKELKSRKYALKNCYLFYLR